MQVCFLEVRVCGLTSGMTCSQASCLMLMDQICSLVDYQICSFLNNYFLFNRLFDDGLEYFFGYDRLFEMFVFDRGFD